MRSRWAAFAFVAILPIACTLSLDGLSGGTPPSDGGTKDTEGGAVDSPSDAPLPVSEASATFRCSDHTSAIFCADFDEDPFDKALDDRPVQNGGVTGSSSTFASPPRAFLGSIAAHGGSNAPTASLQKSINASDFVLSYDLLVGSFKDEHFVAFGGLTYHGPYYTLYLSLTSEPTLQWNLFETGEAVGAMPELENAIPLPSGTVIGSFSHVSMHVTVDPGSSTVSLSIDGKQILASTPISAHKYASQSQIYLGITDDDGTGDALDVLVDNVLVEKP